MCKFTITGFSCVNSEFPLFCKFRVMRFFCVKSWIFCVSLEFPDFFIYMEDNICSGLDAAAQ